MKKTILGLFLCLVMVLLLTPTAVFAVKIKYEISSVALTSYERPQAGETAGDNLAKIKTSESKYTIREIYWVGGSGRLKSTDTFVSGQRYWIEAYIGCSSGYGFGSSCTVTINGDDYFIDPTSVRVTGSGSGASLYFETQAITPVAGPIPIRSVVVTGVPTPVIGQPCTVSNVNVTTTPENSCPLYDIYWWDGDRLETTDVFVKSRSYRLVIEMCPKEGYSFNFAGNSYPGTATFNGEAADMAQPAPGNTNNLFLSSAPKVPATAITTVNVAGVTAPQKGVKPSTGFTVSTNFVKKAQDGKWYNVTDKKWMNGETFEGGKTYEFYAYVVTDEGFGFPYSADQITATLNGKSAQFGTNAAAGTNYVKYSFVCPANTISSLQISNVMEPLPGNKPVNTFKVSTDGVIKAQDGKWYNVTDKKWMKGEPFEVGKTYEFNAYVDVKDNYGWADNGVYAYINGKASSFGILEPEGTGLVYYKFVCPDNNTIANVTITGLTEPVAGEMPNADYTLEGSKLKKSMAGEWVCYKDPKWTEDMPFEEGKEYGFNAVIEAQDGYVWPDYIGSLVVTVNGKTATFANYSGGGGITKIVKYTFVCAACPHSSTEIRNAKAATCTAEGYTGDTYCKTCGEKISSGKAIAKTAHVESDWIVDKAAAPGVEGSRHKECTVCHTKLKTETIPALVKECEHKNTELTNVLAATCTAEGYTGDTVCKDCGKTISTGKKTEKTAHIESDWITDKAAEPGVEGSKHTECTVCHTKLKTEAIPALKEECKHTNTEVTGKKDASCTGIGYTGNTVCKDCGHVLESGSDIPALGHDYRDGVCTRCGEKDPDAEPIETEPTETAPVDTDAPGTDVPGTDAPGTDAPGTDVPGTDAPGTDATNTDAPGTDPNANEKKSVPGWLWALIGVVVGGGGVAAGVIIGKKGKKE